MQFAARLVIDKVSLLLVELTCTKAIYQKLVKADPELEKLPIEGLKVMKAKGEIHKMIEDFFNENQLEEIRDALPNYSILP